MKRFIFGLAVVLGIFIALPAFAQITIDYTVYDDAEAQMGAGWSWSPETKTLAINGFSCQRLIISGVDSPTINVSGENSVKGGETAIFADGELLLAGTGKISLSGTGYGLRTAGKLSIENAAVESDAPNSLYCENGLSVKDARLTASCVRVFGMMTLDGVYIEASGDVPIIYTAAEVKNSVINVSCSDTCAITSNNIAGNYYGPRHSLFSDCVITVNGGVCGISSYGGNYGQGYSFDGCEITFKNVSTHCIAYQSVTMTDTKFTASDCGETPISAELTLNGGNTLIAYGGKYGVLATRIDLTSTDEMRLYGVEAATEAQVFIDGKEIENKKLYRLIVKNGVVTQKRGLAKATIAGRDFDWEQLMSDQSGAGWSWNGGEGRLTLNGYDAGAIELSGSPDISVTGENVIKGGDAALSIKGEARISGGGVMRLSGAEYGLKVTGKTVIDNVDIFAAAEYAVHVNNHLTVSTSKMKLNGGKSSLFISGKMKIDGVTIEATGNAPIAYVEADAKNCDIRVSCSGDIAIGANNKGEFYYLGSGESTYTDCTVRVDGGWAGMATAYLGDSSLQRYVFTNCDLDFDGVSGAGIVAGGVTMTNTKYTKIGSTDKGIAAGDYLRLNGGNNIKASGETHGAATKNVYLTSTDEVYFAGGECACYANVYMDEKEIVNEKLPRLMAKNGVVTQKHGVQSIVINGRTLENNELNTDQAGEGWTWNAQDGSLTLDGYAAGDIAFVGFPILRARGDNSVNGNISSSRLIFEGTGKVAVTGNVNVGKNFEIVSGDISVEGALYANELNVSGGEVFAKSTSLHLFNLSGGTVEAYIYAYNMNVTGGTLESWLSIYVSQNFNMTGGTIRPSEGNGGTLNVVASVANITGGSLTLIGRETALDANEITIGGTANVYLSASVYVLPPYIDSTYHQDICGQKIGLCTLLVIENGVIITGAYEVPIAQVGGERIYRDDLNTDKSGEGWRYDGKKKTLTLDGIDDAGMAVTLYSNAVKLYLAPGSVNHLSEIAFHDKTGFLWVNGAITGDKSTLDCWVYCDGITLTGVNLIREYGTTVEDSAYLTLIDSSVTVSTFDVRKDITLKNSVLRAKGFVGAENKITATDSEIYLSEGYSNVYVSIGAKKITLKNSLAMFGGVISGKSKSFPGSLILKMNSDRYYDVMYSSTLTKPFELPEAKYRIPERVRLEAKKGVSMRFNGPLVVEGTIVGDICSALKAESIEIKGTDRISSNQKVAYKIESTPASSLVSGIVWSSSDEKLATVAQDGTVTAGEVDTVKTVTIKAVADGGMTTTKEISILPATKRIIISIDGVPVEGSAAIAIGDNPCHEIKASFEPEGAYSEVIWKSSKKKIALVNPYEEIYLHKKGKTKITCAAVDGSAKTVITLQVLPGDAAKDDGKKTRRVTDMIEIG